MRTYHESFQRFKGPGMRPPSQIYQSKRPLPVDPSTQQGRPLAPKPLIPGATGPARLQAGSPSTNLSPLGVGPVGMDQPRRKRGRPSKKDQEERRRLVGESQRSELGPLQPALYSPSLQQGRQFLGMGEVPASPAHPPQYGTTGTTPQASSQAGSSNNSGSSGKKRRGRPKNPAASGPPPPFSLESSSLGQAPQQAGRKEEERESDVSSKSRQGGPLAPPETTMGATVSGARSSASGSGQQQTADPEESKSQTRWKDTILNE
jgi:hypothetical protein